MILVDRDRRVASVRRRSLLLPVFPRLSLIASWDFPRGTFREDVSPVLVEQVDLSTARDINTSRTKSGSDPTIPAGNSISNGGGVEILVPFTREGALRVAAESQFYA